jgi:hypothetical protein
MNTRIPHILLRGQLTCETPVSFRLPSPKFAKNRDGQPVLETADGPRLYLNAPALRSVVRHAATELIHELTGRPFHMDDYFLCAVGGIKDAGRNGGDDEGDESDDDSAAGADAKAAQSAREATAQKSFVLKRDFAKAKNPLLMLFGSMDVPGLVECAHAIESPVDAKHVAKAQRFDGVRASDFQRNPAVVDMLAPDALDDFVKRQAAAATRSSMSRDIKDLEARAKKAAKENNAALAAELREQKKELEAGQRKHNAVQLQQLIGYEAIPQGTKLTHEWGLKRVSELELALFLQSLARWALDPKIGGHRNHGLGRLSGQWSVTVRHPGQARFQPFGSLSFQDYDGLSAEGEIARFLDPAILSSVIHDLDFTHASLNDLK